MIIKEIQYFFSKIIRFQAIFKDTVEFTCALEFKISSQRKCIIFSYVYTLYHKTSTLQILGSVSEQIHISLFRNLVFSIPDLIARPLTE